MVSDIFDKDFEDAIEVSIRNILFTSVGELPGYPEFGTRLNEFVFSLADKEFVWMCEKEITFAIEKWEPRIILKNVKVILDEDYNRAIIKIEYTVNNDLRDDYTSRFITFKMDRGV